MSIVMEGPFLTSRATGERRRILDPLGLDAVGANIVRRHLLPGITSSLQHVRYFSLMTWIVGSFEVSDTRLSWTVYRRRLEQAMRIAIKHADPAIRGLIGTDSTPSLDGLQASARIGIDTRNRIPSAFEAQNYGASFGAIGLAHRPPGGAPVLSALGRALYQAVEEEIEAAPRAIRTASRRLQAAPVDATVTELERLSEFFTLRTVETDEPEWEPLLWAVGGIHADDAQSDGDARQRGRTFALVLAALSRHSLVATSWGDLLGLLSGPHLPSDVAEVFPEELEAWRCFGERQAQRIALGALWSVVHGWVEAEAPFGLSVESILQRAVSLLPDMGARAAPGDALHAGLSWVELVEATNVAAGATREGRFDRRRELMYALERAQRDELPSDERIASALRLLALCMATWREEEREADLLALSLHEHGGESRMSLAWMARGLEARRRDQVAGVLRWLVERCVLDQLQRVGYAKGPGTSKVLLVREEDTVLLAREDAHFFFMVQDTNRLGATLAMLEGLSLVEWTDERYLTTSAGSAFLMQVARSAPR